MHLESGRPKKWLLTYKIVAVAGGDDSSQTEGSVQHEDVIDAVLADYQQHVSLSKALLRHAAGDPPD